MSDSENVLKVFNVTRPGPRIEVIYAHSMTYDLGSVSFWRGNRPICVINIDSIERAVEVGLAAEVNQ